MDALEFPADMPEDVRRVLGRPTADAIAAWRETNGIHTHNIIEAMHFDRLAQEVVKRHETRQALAHGASAAGHAPPERREGR
jgi:hypothetical protein